ncbi:hypothetical protein Tco_0492639 [Tanacetum coccineum]
MSLVADYFQWLALYFCSSWAKEFTRNRASSVKVPVANFTLQSSVQLLRENTDSVRLNHRISPTTPSVHLKLIAFAIVAACVLDCGNTRQNISDGSLSHGGASDVDVLLGCIYHNSD